MENKDEQQKRKFKEESKKLLLGDVTRKIKTTMIGSLDAIEQSFTAYFSDENLKLEFLEKFKETRKRILDLGNNQILKIQEDLENYEIECKSYKPKNLLKRK